MDTILQMANAAHVMNHAKHAYQNIIQLRIIVSHAMKAITLKKIPIGLMEVAIAISAK